MENSTYLCIVILFNYLDCCDTLFIMDIADFLLEEQCS